MFNVSDPQSDTIVLIHDALKGLSYWNDFMTGAEPAWSGVAMDMTYYLLNSNQGRTYSDDDHIRVACFQGSGLSSFHLWTIVGKWTLATTDCAKYFNGRGRGAHYNGSYDGTPPIGDCSNKSGRGETFSSEYKTFLREYWEAQIITFERGAGWVHWAWRMEQADGWSYQARLEYGWIPQDPTNRKNPEICDRY